ncbi:MAG: helix-turn-helix transcriptional regulator [Candidatus Gastranaerophilales bacterium]|nr:helix-turn-helix transcriptional regulator [Candidatus Gastranaerophilales bacterium]
MVNGFKKTLGSNIKKFRMEKGFTQEKLALETNVSRSHIAMIELGKRDFTVSTLFKISRALNITIDKIFDFDNLEEYKFDIEKIYE